jgi:hypothetical protein
VVADPGRRTLGVAHEQLDAGKSRAGRQIRVEFAPLGRRDSQLVAALENRTTHGLFGQPFERTRVGRKHHQPGGLPERTLVVRIEVAERLDDVAEQLHPARTIGTGGPDIDYAAADGELARFFDKPRAAVTEAHERFREIFEFYFVVRRQMDRRIEKALPADRSLHDRNDRSDNDRGATARQLEQRRRAAGFDFRGRRDHFERRRFSLGKKMDAAVQKRFSGAAAGKTFKFGNEVLGRS